MAESERRAGEGRRGWLRGLLGWGLRSGPLRGAFGAGVSHPARGVLGPGAAGRRLRGATAATARAYGEGEEGKGFAGVTKGPRSPSAGWGGEPRHHRPPGPAAGWGLPGRELLARGGGLNTPHQPGTAASPAGSAPRSGDGHLCPVRADRVCGSILHVPGAKVAGIWAAAGVGALYRLSPFSATPFPVAETGGVCQCGKSISRLSLIPPPHTTRVRVKVSPVYKSLLIIKQTRSAPVPIPPLVLDFCFCFGFIIL